MTKLMEQWIQEWFGIEPPAPGEDWAMRLRMPFAWPSWLVLIVLVALLVTTWAIYRREHGEAGRGLRRFLAFLRLATFAVLLLMLFELDLVVDRRGLPYLLLVVDQSQSMTLTDRYVDEDELRLARELASLGGAGSDPQGLPERWSIARGMLLRNDGEILRRLVQQYRVRVYLAGTSPQLLAELEDERAVQGVLKKLMDIEPTAPQTRLGDAVRSLLGQFGGVPPAAMVLVTDGVLTEGTPWDEAARLARQKGVPLHFVGIGESETALDIELRDLVADDVAFVGDLMRFELKLVARGIEEPQRVRVVLERNGTPVATQEVDVRQPDRPIPVQLRYEPQQKGEVTFALRAVPLSRERDTANNVLRHTVHVRDQKLRVLLVEGLPRLEFRFLKHYLERDRTVELRTLLLSADPQHPEQDRTAVPSFPVSPEELNQYDAVILGDVGPLYFQPSQIEMLADFVLERAGGLVLIAGRDAMPMRWRDTPLDPLIPVDLQVAEPGPNLREPFRLRLTAEGMALPPFQFGQTPQENRTIWASLPGHYWYLHAPKLKPGAIPLAVHPMEQGDEGPLAIIVLQYAGAGKVLLMGIDSTWRWRDMVRDRYFGRFWVHSLRYVTRARLLGQTRQAELMVDRRQYLLGQPVRIRLRLLDDALKQLATEGVTVLVQGGDDPPIRVVLEADETAGVRGLFRGEWTPAQEGDYRVTLLTPPVQGEAPQARFQVVAAPDEFRRVEMAQAAMEEAARLSEGSFHRIAGHAHLFRQLPPGRKVPLEVEPPISLWDTWPMLLLFAFFLTLEWALRKRARML